LSSEAEVPPPAEDTIQIVRRDRVDYPKGVQDDRKAILAVWADYTDAPPDLAEIQLLSALAFCSNGFGVEMVKRLLKNDQLVAALATKDINELAQVLSEQWEIVPDFRPKADPEPVRFAEVAYRLNNGLVMIDRDVFHEGVKAHLLTHDVSASPPTGDGADGSQSGGDAGGTTPTIDPGTVKEQAGQIARSGYDRIKPYLASAAPYALVFACVYGGVWAIKKIL
jgi:hypothetical protein